jgi:hypothetical protein
MAAAITPSFSTAPTSALPEALRELASRVARETRLWKSEKSDLQAELESHFREGLIELTEGGLSVEESIATLRDDFGDPKLAAKLIRRSKKRGRPMIWKLTVGIGTTLLITVAAGAGWTAYLAYGTPNPTIDYVAKLNEPLATTPEQDRAWPLLRDALLQMKPMPEAFTAMKSANLTKPGGEGWDVALAWLNSNRGIIGSLIAASKKPTYGFEYGNKQSKEYMAERAKLNPPAERPSSESDASNEVDPLAPPMLALLLPHLADVRVAAKLLVFDARESLSRGDFESAWASLDGAFRLGAHMMGGRALIEQLVGVACMSLAMSEMRSALQSNASAMTSDRLALINSGGLMSTNPDIFKFNILSERFFFEDVVQYAFTDDGAGNGRLIPSQYGKIATMGMPEDESTKQSDAGLLAIATVHADRATTVAKYFELADRLGEVYELPLYDSRREKAWNIIETELPGDGSGNMRFSLISLLMPSLSRANQLMREGAMNLEATVVAVKLATYIATKGHAPRRLGELVPEHLQSVPVDVYAGTHLKYILRYDGSPLMYSVGRNLIDDAGSTQEVIEPRGSSRTPADLVYWGEK